MVDRRIPQQLELLVEGELGQAVLAGFSLVANAAMGSMVDAGEYDRVMRVMATARANALDVVVPASIAPEMRAAYEQTVVQAVEYAFEYAPGFRDE